MNICPGCNQPVRFYQPKGGSKGYHYNSSWHGRCANSYERGRRDADRFADEECQYVNAKTPLTLYWERMKATYWAPIG